MSPASAPPTIETRVGDLTIAYRDVGSGPAVLLLHGWPTSSYLWRNVMGPIAERNRVLAPDLPGFGGSSKPLDASYSFPFFEGAIDGFLAELGVERLAGLAVHDIGGPIGVHWAIQNPERVERLALLNTLLYPRLSLAAAAFVVGGRIPGIRGLLTSRRGLDLAMRLGVHNDKERLTPEVLAAVREPFADADARRALAKAGTRLSPNGLKDIERALPGLKIPVRVVYGERDRILPDVARTMAKVKRDVPHAEVTALPDAGHFLQEDAPERIGPLLAEFFAA